MGRDGGQGRLFRAAGQGAKGARHRLNGLVGGDVADHHHFNRSRADGGGLVLQIAKTGGGDIFAARERPASIAGVQKTGEIAAKYP